jgi:hypothetical protein
MHAMTTLFVVVLIGLGGCSRGPTWALWETAETYETTSSTKPSAQSTKKLEGGLDRLSCESHREQAEDQEKGRGDLTVDLQRQAAATEIRQVTEPVTVKQYACKVEN